MTIDTAAVYRNEAAIGHSLKRILEQNLVPGLTRQDIFLISKLGTLKDHDRDVIRGAIVIDVNLSSNTPRPMLCLSV